MNNEKLKEEVEKLSNFRSCEECGAVYDKRHMHKVTTKNLVELFMSGRQHILPKEYYCKKHAPKIYEGVKKIQTAWNESNEDEVIEDVYKNAESISIDYAISEKADNLLLVPASFNWNDVGDWKVVFEVGKKDKEDNVFVKTGKKGEIYNINSNNNLVRFEDRLVALIDVENLVVIDTKDALLICKKDKAQNVKELVNVLKEKNKEEYL